MSNSSAATMDSDEDAADCEPKYLRSKQVNVFLLIATFSLCLQPCRSFSSSGELTLTAQTAPPTQANVTTATTTMATKANTSNSSALASTTQTTPRLLIADGHLTQPPLATESTLSAGSSIPLTTATTTTTMTHVHKVTDLSDGRHNNYSLDDDSGRWNATTETGSDAAAAAADNAPISASEISSGSVMLAPAQSGRRRLHQTSSGDESKLFSSSDRNSGEQLTGDLNGSSISDSELDVIGSRMLLQMLVLTLLGLVSLSLVIVYGIKFWLCKSRRRKRLLLRRALVCDSSAADGSISYHVDANTMTAAAMALLNNVAVASSSATSGSHEIPLDECACGSGYVPASSIAAGSSHHSSVAGVFPSMQSPPLPLSASSWLSAAPNNAHGAASDTADTWQPGGSNWSRNSNQPTTTAGQLPSYWSSQQSSTGASNSATTTITSVSTIVPPPAYEDLYRPTGSSHASNVAQPQPQPQSQSQPLQPSSSATCNARQNNQQNQQQVNLLLRLNLDRTRLLSANDLMLLSRLIDAPVTVLQAQPVPNSSERNDNQDSSCSNNNNHEDDGDEDDNECEEATQLAQDSAIQLTLARRGSN